MTRYLGWLCAAFALALVPLTSTASDWTNWRGPWQTGVSPDKGLPDKVDGNVIWRKPYVGRSTPVVLNGNVYLINYDSDKVKAGEKFEDVPETIVERVMCLDAKTGERKWEHTFPIFHTDVVTSRLGWTNLAADPVTGYIYAHGTQGLFMCLDGKSGKVLWQHSMGEEFGRVTGYGGRITSPVIDEDLVILGMVNSSWGTHGKGANRHIAFDKRTGKAVWWSEPAGLRGTYYSQPVIATIKGQRLMIVGAADGTVVAVKVRTGEPVWSFQVSVSAINASPVVAGDHVFIGHGEESPGSNVQGRFVCLDAGTIENGQPKLVWDREGLVARYASPIVHEGKVYVPDEACTLFCLDAKNGKELWKFRYGKSEQRGSPVLADGKIYLGEVNSQFHVLNPNKPEKNKRLDSHFFAGAGGVPVELNGTPAVANGRIYFSTSEETICIGTKDGISAPNPPEEIVKVKIGKIAHLQILPADVTLHTGGTTTFKARAFDADGNFVKEVEPEWSLPAPKAVKGAKAAPPALKGDISKDGKLTIDAKLLAQQGLVAATFEGITGRARVRVAPRIPYAPDFAKIPDGVPPGGWIGAGGKLLVKTIDGKKVLSKVNDKFLFSAGSAYITTPTSKDYTIQCDVFGTQVGDNLPEIGVGANRYSLILVGNVQKLRLQSWEALPRVDKTIDFKFQPKVWYRLKLTTDIADGKGTIRGKAWPRDQKEPADWTVELTDSRPVTEGSALLYGYVTGNINDKPGTEIYYENLKISPNKAAGKKSANAADEIAPPRHEVVLRERRPLFPLLARLRR